MRHAALLLLLLVMLPLAAAAQEPAPVPAPPITEEDRRAAFPDVHGHTVHDGVICNAVLFDQRVAVHSRRARAALGQPVVVRRDRNRL